MDHILASEVLVVVLQAPEGLTFSEFRRLFHSTHGYPLDLARYGYRSLQHLLDDMKDLVVVVEAADQEPQIACRSIHQHTYIFLGENEISPEVGLCSAQAMEKPSASNRPRDVPGLGEISLSSSQCSLSSGVQTPSSDIFLTEKKNTHLEEDCCDQASLDDLHQLNIQCMESAEVSHYVLHHQEGLQEASELLTNSLSTFPTGLKLRKLKEVVKNKHGTDLEELSRSLGCVDVLHLLQHLPNIRILHPLKPANCVVQLQGGLWKTPLSSSQCSFASGVLTPSSDAFLAEEKDTLLKEDCIDQATLDDLQQLNIQCMENEEASHYVVPQHKDSKPSDGCKKSNYEKRGTAPPRSQSASKTSKNTALTSRPLPCNSSATPGSIHPQNSIHIQNTPRQSFRKPSPLTNQTKSKAKSKPARRNATPTKPQATKESLVKYPFKIQKPPLKQTAADQLSKPLVVTHHNHQHQEKSYTPQVSRLRTAALSYSSVVSQNIAEAPANESPLNNPPAPYPTSIHYIDASKTEHSAPNFSPPISDFPHLSEKTKNGSYCSRAMESEHLLASQKNGEELKNNISCVLEAHPKGMSLFQFQHTYRTMFHRMLPLNGYTTVKQMLEEMKEVVRMEDLGVQCWLFPVSSHAVSSQRMDLEFGLQNQPVSEQLGHSIHATMSTVNQLKNKLQNESQHKLVTSKALLDNPARNLSKPGHQDDLKNTCGPGHPIGTTTVWTEHPSSHLNQPLDNETLKHIPFSQLLSNEFPPLQHLHTQNNDASQLSTNKCTGMQDASITPYSNIVKGNNEVDLSSNSISANLPATTSFSDEQIITSLCARSEKHSHPQLSVPTADPHHLPVGRQDDLSYRETAGLVSDAPPKVPTCAEELKSNIFQVLTQYPDGMSIFQFQKTYRFMFNHIIPLEGYSSVKQLLLTIPDVVKTRGLGVQMVVFPFYSDVPCCQVILEENGLSLSEMETVPYPTEQESALRNTTSSAKMPLSLNSTPSAKGVAAHVLSTSSETSASFHPGSYALNPEATVFSPSSTMCFPQFPSVDLNGVSTPVSIDISGDNCHTTSVPNFHAQCHTLISDCAPKIAQPFNDPSTSLLTPPLSPFKPFFTNSGANPSNVVEQSAISSECHNEWVSSGKVLSNDYKNQQARTWSQVVKCEDSDLLTDACFVSDTIQKKGTFLCPKTTRPQKSKTKQPVQFVGLFTDLHSTNYNNSDMIFFGSKSEKPTSQT